MATQLGPCDSPGCSGQRAPCFQQLPKSTHLRAKCGWPGCLQWVILVLTYPCFLNTSHLGAHLPNSHAPAHRSHCRGLSLSAGALHGPTQVRPSVLLQAANQAPREAAFMRTDRSRWIESLLSHGDVQVPYCLHHFPSGMKLQFPSSTYSQCPTQVPWKGQYIQSHLLRTLTVRTHSCALQLRIALSQQEPTCLEISGRLHPP